MTFLKSNFFYIALLIFITSCCSEYSDINNEIENCEKISIVSNEDLIQFNTAFLSIKSKINGVDEDCENKIKLVQRLENLKVIRSERLLDYIQLRIKLLEKSSQKLVDVDMIIKDFKELYWGYVLESQTSLRDELMFLLEEQKHSLHLELFCSQWKNSNLKDLLKNEIKNEWENELYNYDHKFVKIEFKNIDFEFTETPDMVEKSGRRSLIQIKGTISSVTTKEYRLIFKIFKDDIFEFETNFTGSYIFTCKEDSDPFIKKSNIIFSVVSKRIIPNKI